MNWTLAIPEIVLSISGLIILLFGALKKDNSFFPCAIFSVAAFIAVGFLALTIPDGVGYHGLFINDAFSRYMKLLVLIAGLLCVILSIDFNGKNNTNCFEFIALIVFSTVGAMIMVSSNNLMSLYLGLELSSLALYILCAIDRNSVFSAESGVKYFVLGSVASGILLYGISMVYGFSGGMGYENIHHVIASSNTTSVGFAIGLVFVLVGLCFKISAVPFHMWTPDVYQGAPTPVTTFLSTSPKFAAFALFLRLMVGPFGQISPQWQLLIEVIAILSIIIGSVGAIAQINIKRMMAYSSIAHMGYALVGLAAATSDGVLGTLIYLTTYLFMNVGTFAVIAAMTRKGHVVENINDLAGLGKTDPGIATAMAIFMFSMAGVPPLAGFFGKFMVFWAAISAHLYLLTIVGILASAVGAFFYLRIVKIMFFDKPAEALDQRSLSLSFISFGMGTLTVIFLLFMSPMLHISKIAAQSLFH
ncbi:NADH-quinone oxidoreductase subunit NuoN [Commensalibacter oyaizuii]|uniref:NADH-quinone oxidoreductase subunit N n=1 Tax=Commensalibacter oyaizuii TaxID=3043873 RepID=A0ABT6PZT4_9PROT|nr:NADH-quinone oxidoreductase subunit NuoN [Commensalibacter sp. TBRC 16381]MDI2090372.1 NADH-quinone oxidoreductase subunit NuoN [Commensalibacter sp. TBRC 16381]